MRNPLCGQWNRVVTRLVSAGILVGALAVTPERVAARDEADCVYYSSGLMCEDFEAQGEACCNFASYYWETPWCASEEGPCCSDTVSIWCDWI